MPPGDEVLMKSHFMLLVTLSIVEFKYDNQNADICVHVVYTYISVVSSFVNAISHPQPCKKTRAFK